MCRGAFLIAFLFLSYLSAYSQAVSFQYFTTADGLSGNQTTTPVQDDQGFLWFLNSKEIHRYDGRHFYRFPNPFSLFSEYPLDLVIYEDSFLLVSARNHIGLINTYTFESELIPLPKAASGTYSTFHISSQGINAVLLSFRNDPQESIHHFLFEDRQMKRIGINDLQNISSSDNYYCISRTVQGEYLLFHNRRLKILNQSEKLQTDLQLPRSGLFCRPPSDVHPLTYVDLDSRMYTFDPKHDLVRSHPINSLLTDQIIRSFLYVSDDGSFWAVGQKKTIVYYDAVRDSLHDYSEIVGKIAPDNNDFLGIFQDKAGTIWVGTLLGLLRIQPQNSFFDTYFHQERKFCEGNCSFRGMTEDQQGNIYASFYFGIISFDPETKEEKQVLQSGNHPFDLFCDDTYLWLNSGQRFHLGLQKLQNPDTKYSSNLDAGVFEKDKQGQLWMAVHGKLFRLEEKGERFGWREELVFSDDPFDLSHILHEDHQAGYLWFSFGAKLYAYLPKTGELKTYSGQDIGYDFKQIFTLEEDKEGNFWLGTDNGLLHWNPADQITRRFTTEDGLPNNYICGILPEGDSCLWLSTNFGLSRLHIESEHFMNFFEKDGLSFNEFNRKSFFKAQDGRMFFGGMRGLNGFYPTEVVKAYEQKNKESKVVFSAFEYVDENLDSMIRNNFLKHSSEIRLNHWDKSFTFEYAFTDFSHPKEISYSYLMEGYEEVWSIPSINNFARFSSLPPGKYTFRVKARDHMGDWHPNELAVKVTMLPAWWQSKLAYSFYVLLVGMTFWLIYQFLRRRLLLQNQLLLEQQEATRLKKLHQFKTRFYTNLTHEFRTPLTVILGMVRQVRESPDRYLNSGTELIERNGKNLLQLINQILDLSKLENNAFQLELQQGDIIPFLRYMTGAFFTLANSHNLSLGFYCTVDSVVMDYDPEQVKQILSNLFSNAIKFTPSGGELRLQVSANESHLLLEVKDTGIGIANENLPHVFDHFYQVESETTHKWEGTGIGLAHTQELVKLMGGEISVSSSLGKGTSFFVKLPIQKDSGLAQSSTPIGMEIAKAFVPQENEREADPLRNPVLPHRELPFLLIIEDNLDVVAYLRAILEQDYQLDIAYNGKIGIEKAFENVPDLIISDIMMPEKDGFEVCDILKNDIRSSHIPIILLTAKADVESKMVGLKRGADAYLPKPFDKEELVVRIEMMLAHRERLKSYLSRQYYPQDSNKESGMESHLQPEQEFMREVRKIISDHYQEETFGLRELCRRMSMSRSQLFRKMKALIGISPSLYIRSYRLQKARELLATGELNVSEVCWEVGFKNLAHFSRIFQEEYGMSPREARR